MFTPAKMVFKIFFVIAIAVLGISWCQISTTPSMTSTPGRKINVFRECRNKTNATGDDLKFYKTQEFPKTKNAECFLACLEKRSGYLMANNSVNVTKAMEQIEYMKSRNPRKYNATLQIIQDCKKAETVQKDECTAAKENAICIFNKKKETGVVRGWQPH